LFSFQYFFFYLSHGSYYYCNNRSLSFLFRCCAKKTSNLREVRFGEVAVLKQILVLHRKNSWKILRISFWPAIYCPYAPGYIQTFISFALFYLSNRSSSKKSTFVSCSILTDFCHYLCLPLDRFLFEFFWSRNFWGSCYSSICFICGVFELKPEPKRVDSLLWLC
jgi:hypothetical protein